MKIIISPAKKMREEVIGLPVKEMPVYLDKSKQLLQYLKSLNYEQLKELWNCSDALCRKNSQRLEGMNLDSNLSCAIASYDGIQYQYMGASVFSDEQFAYLEDHLRILSGLYGVLKPFDGVTPYRLEMQAKIQIGDIKDCYQFWADSLYKDLNDPVIINLASKEYSDAIEPYLKENDQFITIVFASNVKGKLVQKGTIAKMARGAMVRYMAENKIEDTEELKKFDLMDFHFDCEQSNDKILVFVRKDV